MCEAIGSAGKSEHLSRMLAENAVELHRWTAPDCTTIEAYPCGDHYHVGHSSHAAGEACKAAHPFRRPSQPGRGR